MRLLFIHADYIRFLAKEKAIVDAEEVTEKERKVDNCLVVFVAVEQGDDDNTVGNAISEIDKVANTLKIRKVVLYPWVHLTSNPASPPIALDLLRKMQQRLANDYDVCRAPFGWYKEFELKCKGHALAELSREIRAEIVSKALRDEEKLKSYWYIMTPDGTLHEIDNFDFKDHKNLEKFVSYEIKKDRRVKEEPPHVKLMRRLEIADYEDGSDPGNLRYYPKGRLIKLLLERWIREKMLKLGAMEVETPVMYDFAHPALAKYLHRFPARQYIVKSAKKTLFLRFAACFGQFLMKKDMVISYRDLPLKLFEITRYSFRLEKRGELTGLRRLRAFTMPDMHTLCNDLEEAKQEFFKQYKACIECMHDIGLSKEDYEVAIRFTKDFFEKNKEFIRSLVRLINKPILIEMWEERPFYFILKFEFNFIDALGKASALSTVQIDVENAERYNIVYYDEDGSAKHPIILHASLSGALERCMYAMLEKAYMRKIACLPTWLSPTQVRVIPVSEKYVEFANQIMEELESAKIRVDIDDRDESVARKIRDAEREWIPYILVVGEKEMQSKEIAVRVKPERKVVKMKIKDLIERIKEECKNKPIEPINIPKYLSKRPIFVSLQD